MRLKYVIHRSKKPFAQQKEVFRKIINFYSGKYPGLRFIDKGLRFSAEYKDLTVDFDFGYLNMRYRDFSGYHAVISQGVFGILDSGMNPGDLAFPTHSDMLRINNDQSKVRLYKRTATFNNQMEALFSSLMKFEEKQKSEDVKAFVSKEFGQGASVGSLSDLNVKSGAHFIESNTLFRPSKLKTSSALLKAGEERLPIPNLENHLRENFVGIDCETKQMIENVGDRLAMFSVGINKPYEGIELTNDIRMGKNLKSKLPTYEEGRVAYFQSMLFEYLLNTQNQTVAA